MRILNGSIQHMEHPGSLLIDFGHASRWGVGEFEGETLQALNIKARLVCFADSPIASPALLNLTEKQQFYLT